MGPSVKFVSPNKGLISKKKMGVNFFRVKNDQTGGGGPGGGLAKDHIFSQFFLRPSLIDDSRQVQFPLSLVTIKFKHFLLFGLGVPLANTLLWLILRLCQQVFLRFSEEKN